MPGSPIAQYCPECTVERKIIQSSESKRREETLKLNEQYNYIPSKINAGYVIENIDFD